MQQWLKRSEEALKQIGYPIGDQQGRYISPKTFADGCHYRMEISGVEKPSTLYALIDEAEKIGVTIHRVIGSLMGSTWLTNSEIKEFSTLANEAGIEIIMVPGQRPQWEVGKQSTSQEGSLSGLRLRGQDSIKYYLSDIFRALDQGIRGFLVWDEGVLSVLNELRQKEVIPKETIYKISILAGHGNAAGARLLQELGANSFNPVNDLTVPMYASIRQMTDLPMDIHVSNFDSFGGQTRFWEMPEIVVAASPCYLKLEPGPSMAAMARPWLSEDNLSYSIRQKVKSAKTTVEIIQDTYPELKLSEPKCSGLAIPEI